MTTQLLLSTSNSLLEVDNIFICVERMPKPEFFQKAGLNIADTPMQQKERGTASQIIFFENFYVEFIWIEDEVAAEIYAVRTGIDFVGRCNWRQTGVSPFGIALRQKPDATNSANEDEDDIWQKQPQASEILLSFSSDNLVAQNEPLCFMIPDAIALPTLLKNFPNFQAEMASHELGVKRMTGIEVTATLTNPLTQPLAMLVESGEVQIEQGHFPAIQLTFDNHVQREIINAWEIGIPMTLKY
ncbi:MAG: hypothetical protein HC785_12405 [Calothrix sp. CSU_2_0]|nr:hypothetical protein [Calothrix sp. CSU_2_0]